MIYKIHKQTWRRLLYAFQLYALKKQVCKDL